MKQVKTSKEVRSIDLANDELVAGLVSTLNESAQVAWFEKAVTMLNNQVISVRGLKATIEKAQDSTWLKPSHVPYFVTARALRSKSGGDKVALKKVITTVQDAKRAFGSAEKFAEAFEKATTFKAFSDSIPERESKGRGAGKQTSSEKEHQGVPVDADAVASLALGLFRELEGEAALFGNIANAEALVNWIRQQIANTRANASAHPVASKGRAKANA